MSTMESIIRLTREREHRAFRERYQAIVNAVADRLTETPLRTNETIAQRLTPTEVMEVAAAFDALRAQPTSFETDVQGVMQLRRANASRDTAQTAADALRSPVEIDRDLVVQETVADIVAEAARVPVVELEAERRRHRTALDAVEYAERAVANASRQLSGLMKDSD